VIGQIVRVDTTITNNGPDQTDVQAQIDFPYQVADSWTRQLRLYGTGDMAQCVGDATTLHLTCSKTLASGDSWVIHSEFGARAPGTTGLTVTATSAVADPDLTNNTAAWQYDVQCSIMGTPGDDTLVAGAGESACGLGGNDTLIGGHGTLGLWGGDGNDRFDLGNTDDVLAGGGPGLDTADYSDVPLGVIVCPEPRSGVLGEFTRSGPYGAVTIGVENIIGTQFADRIVGGAGTNVIRGGGGNDWISGQGGDDTIYGGSGNDSLYSADRHADTVIGGIGADKSDADGHDTVTSASRYSMPPPTDPCSWGW
jgi:Ca2+-binding RTX toxin-like protein